MTGFLSCITLHTDTGALGRRLTFGSVVGTERRTE